MCLATSIDVTLCRTLLIAPVHCCRRTRHHANCCVSETRHNVRAHCHPLNSNGRTRHELGQSPAVVFDPLHVRWVSDFRLPVHRRYASSNDVWHPTSDILLFPATVLVCADCIVYRTCRIEVLTQEAQPQMCSLFLMFYLCLAFGFWGILLAVGLPTAIWPPQLYHSSRAFLFNLTLFSLSDDGASKEYLPPRAVAKALPS